MARPTGSGVAAAVSATVLLLSGWLAGYSELVLIGAACAAALLVAAAWMAVTRPLLDAQRELRPPRVCEGDAAWGVLTVTNRSRHPSPPVTAVEMFAGRRVAVLVPALAGGGSHTTRYRLPAVRRGEYGVEPLTVAHSDPFRFLHRGRPCGARSALIVHPAVLPVSAFPVGWTRDAEDASSGAAPPGGSAFHGLRPYVHGDDGRLIHWKSTVRTGTLMVRHHVIPDQPRHVVVLDTSTAPYTAESFEDAVRVAASVCVAAVREGYPLEVRTTARGGAVVALDAPGRVGTATAALDLLARVGRTDDDEGLTALEAQLPHREGAILTLVTGDPAEADLTVLPAIRRRFLTAVLVPLGAAGGAPAGNEHGFSAHGFWVIAPHTSGEFPALWNALVAP